MVSQVTKNGGSVYLRPDETYLKNNPSFAQETMMIDFITNKVDFSNPQTHYFEKSNTGYKRYIPIYVANLREDQIPNNTAANRERWAGQQITLHNSPAMIAQYSYHDRMKYGGDMTPDGSELPYLSEFLVLEEVMNIIFINYPDLDLSTILTEPEIFEAYFHPTHRPFAQALFGFQAGLAGGNGAGGAGGPVIPGLQPFQM